MGPQEIARLISEDLTTNNGLLFESQEAEDFIKGIIQSYLDGGEFYDATEFGYDENHVVYSIEFDSNMFDI